MGNDHTGFIKGNALAGWLRLPAVWGTGTPPPRGDLPAEGARSTIGILASGLGCASELFDRPDPSELVRVGEPLAHAPHPVPRRRPCRQRLCHQLVRRILDRQKESHPPLAFIQGSWPWARRLRGATV